MSTSSETRCVYFTKDNPASQLRRSYRRTPSSSSSFPLGLNPMKRTKSGLSALVGGRACLCAQQLSRVCIMRGSSVHTCQSIQFNSAFLSISLYKSPLQGGVCCMGEQKTPFHVFECDSLRGWFRFMSFMRNVSSTVRSDCECSKTSS